MDLLLKKICHRSLLRICTLPASNPVSAQAIKYFRKPARSHRTNIQQLLSMFEVDPFDMEIVPAVSRPPTYQLPFDITIAESKEEALEQESKDPADIRLYSDGSCQNGYVGASAVLYRAQNGIIINPVSTLRYRLGPDTEYSIWDAEAAGITMALWLLKGIDRLSHSSVSLYSDSQAVLRSIRAQRAKPGYHWIRGLTDLAETLFSGGVSTNSSSRPKLNWIAAHKDVKGNEKADEEAKKAAAGETSRARLLPQSFRTSLPPSVGATKHQFLVKLRDEWSVSWDFSPRKARMEKFDEDFPFEKHRKLTDQLTRVQSSLIFQIRSNHLPLNCYLHRIGKAPSRRCEKCWHRRRIEVTETVIHYLFECPSFDYERHTLDSKLKRDSRDLKKILSDPDHVRTLLSFIGSTKRFKELGDVAAMRNPP